MVKTILTVACAVLWLAALVVTAFTTANSEQWSKETAAEESLALRQEQDRIDLDRMREIIRETASLYEDT